MRNTSCVCVSGCLCVRVSMRLRKTKKNHTHPFQRTTQPQLVLQQPPLVRTPLASPATELMHVREKLTVNEDDHHRDAHSAGDASSVRALGGKHEVVGALCCFHEYGVGYDALPSVVMGVDRFAPRRGGIREVADATRMSQESAPSVSEAARIPVVLRAWRCAAPMAGAPAKSRATPVLATSPDAVRACVVEDLDDEDGSFMNKILDRPLSVKWANTHTHTPRACTRSSSPCVLAPSAGPAVRLERCHPSADSTERVGRVAER